MRFDKIPLVAAVRVLDEAIVVDNTRLTSGGNGAGGSGHRTGAGGD